MKIVGGKNKGRCIRVPKKGIRPTKGIVRGAIFNIIGPQIHNDNVLDIFAGSGALGLEAISRGAKSCVFIERKPKILLENIKNFRHLTKKIRVISSDFRQGLKWVNEQFDIIFVDPPYHKNYIQKALGLITKHSLLTNQGIVVVEHHYKEKFALPKHFSMSKEKKYGETIVSFLAKNDSNNNS